MPTGQEGRARHVTRRSFLGIGLGAAGAVLLAACGQQPAPTAQVVEVTRVVEKEKPVEVTKVVEKSVEVTKVVEKQVVITATAAKAKQFTLSFWWFPLYTMPNDLNLEMDHIKALFASFAADKPNVKLDPQVIPNSGWNQKVTTAMAAKQWPTVIYQLDRNWLLQGVVEPIDAFVDPKDKADFPEWLWNMYVFRGKTYAWPWIMDPSPFFAVCKEVWENAGALDLLPTGPTREWKSVEAWQEAIIKVGQSKTKDGGQKVWGHAQTINGYTYWLPQEMANFAGKAQVWLDENDNCVIDKSPEAAAFLDLYKKMVTDKIVPDPISVKREDTHQFFYKKQLGTHLHFSVVMTSVATALTQGTATKPFTTQFTAPPHKAGSKPVMQAGSAAWTVLKQTDPDILPYAHGWANYVSKDKVGTFDLGHRFPTRKSDLEYYKDKDPEMMVAGQIAAASDVQKVLPATKVWPGNYWDDPWQPNLQAFFSGQKTAVQALQDAAKQLNALAKPFE